MTYDYRENKLVAVLAANLEPGIALNVLGHLAISMGAHADRQLMGRAEYVDASGVSHRGISKYPVIITKVKPGRLRRLIQDAREDASIFLCDYPEQMLHTGHDDELAAAIGSAREDSINYLGALLYGSTAKINQLTGNFSLWS